MNNKIKNKIDKLCKKIKKVDYIEGIFATDLEEKNLIILNIVINSKQKNYNLNNKSYTKKKNGINYEYYIFYHPKEIYNSINYDNLNDKQILFLELLTLSDIFIDKTGDLTYLKNNINSKYKNNKK